MSKFFLETYMGLMAQICMIVFMSTVFYGMSLLAGLIFIQFCLIIFTIYNLMEVVKSKITKYLTPKN